MSRQYYPFTGQAYEWPDEHGPSPSQIEWEREEMRIGAQYHRFTGRRYDWASEEQENMNTQKTTMTTETYEVRVEQAPHTVISGPTDFRIKCPDRAAAEAAFAKWAALPERVASVTLARITTEVVARWPE